MARGHGTRYRYLVEHEHVLVTWMVSDMADETQSIRESSRPLKKYGSTCNHIKRPDNCIKHVISQGDTLQGIALKYGATMEQIRRLNRLWASDSLFLREHLLVPVPADTSTPPSHLVLDVNSFKNPDGGHPSETERSIDEFLDQIDSSIANTKSQVKKVQGNSEFRGGVEDGVRRKAATSRLRQHYPQGSSSVSVPVSVLRDDLLTAPQPVVMTQGRKVRSSLQRLEREQDEIFEL